MAPMGGINLTKGAFWRYDACLDIDPFVENVQVRSVRISTVVTVVLALVLGASLPGCSDSPEEKAARELRSSVDKTLGQMSAATLTPAQGSADIDYVSIYAQSRDRLNIAMQKGRVAGSTEAGARLASADLALAQAEHLRLKLSEKTGPVDKLLTEAFDCAGRISELQAQRGSLNNVLESMDCHVSQLRAIIDGSAEQSSLKEQLNVVNVKLAKLLQSKGLLEEEARASRQVLDSIQARADEKMTQAETASGDEQLALKQQGYQLMLSRRKHFVKMQQAIDQARLVQSDIDIVQPQVLKINADLQSAQSRLDAAENQPNRPEIDEQLKQIAGEMSAQVGRVSALADELKNAQTAYALTVQQIEDLFVQAVTDYDGVSSQRVALTAATGIADSYLGNAITAAQAATFYKQTGGRLGAIASVDDKMIAPAFAELIEQFSVAQPRYVAKASGYFDAAIGQYEKVHGQTPGGEVGTSVTKSYLLALYGRMLLAESIEDIDSADATYGKAEKLVAQAVEADPAFSRSVVLKLFEGLEGYVPQMEVDRSAYFEGIRRQFQSWKTKRSAAEKEAEVDRLLQGLKNMRIANEDPELVKALQPEWDELNTAKEKGFKEEPVQPSGPADANSLW